MERKIMWLLFFVTLTSTLPIAITASEFWVHHLVLDLDGKFHVYWTPTEDSIAFQVEVATTGYVGLGLSPNGGMAASDIVIGWVSDGKVFLQDRHGVGNTFPPMDTHQDWTLMGGSENGTHTVIKFQRKLQTCDPEDMEIDDSTIRLIYAYHDEDPKTEYSPSYHGQQRGARSVMLLQPQVKRHENVEGMAYWDVKSPNFTITSQYDSIYWCKIHKAPELDEKHHIIKIEPLIQANNERFLHHLVLYECVGGTPKELEPYVDHHGHECYHPNMPPAMSECEGVFAAWGVGGEPMVFPDHVGLPLEAKPPKYYMLEIHYDNPSRKDGIKDDSGFRIYYTSELRQYDAGTFMIGAAVTPRMFIPPSLKEFTVVGHSSHECIGSEMEEDGVKMLGVFLHAHLLGRKLKARHFRGNKELPPLGDDRHYDFNYQEYHYFDEEVTFLPNDQITVECAYDSSQRSSLTFGGLSTKDEMCLAFILYYPRIERFGCMSVATLPLITGLVGAVNLRYENSVGLSSQASSLRDLITHLLKFDWSSINITVMENALRYSPHQTFCYIGTGSKGDMKDLVSYPKDLQPYQKLSSCPQPTEELRCPSELNRQVDNSNTKPTAEIVTLLLALSAAFATGLLLNRC